MKIAKLFGVTAIIFGATTGANCATLNLTLAVDNSYSVYLSTDNSVLGTLIGSGSNWQVPNSFSTALSGSGTYFIQVIGTNDPPPTTGNPDAFIGSFSITGGGYSFSNGGTTLNTDTTHWLGFAASNNSTWTTPTVAPLFLANNGGGIWGSVNGGPEAGIDSAAQWIWSNPDNLQFAEFSTQISATPIPAAIWLFGTVLAGCAGVGRWRKGQKRLPLAA